MSKYNSEGKRNSNYRHGKYCKNNPVLTYCKDCGVKITIKSIRCYKCRSIIDNPFKGKKHTEATRKIIGLKSKDKFTKAFINRWRKSMEKAGAWIPKEELRPYVIYFREAEWLLNTGNYLCEEEKILIKKKGLSSYKNKGGVVRDHKYSRWDGYKNKVPSIILRHPANCKLITRAGNISKRRKSSISLSNLFNLIKQFDKNWIEQEYCMQAISLYNKRRVKSKSEVCYE